MTERQPMLENAQGRWTEQGTGAPVILVHGIPTSPRLWRHVMPLVQGRCLAWEMPGYGTSIPQGANKDLSLSAQAGYLLEWLDSLNLGQKPVLVGHDLGGGVADSRPAAAKCFRRAYADKLRGLRFLADPQR